MLKNKDKLIFVYNADSSVFSQVSDAVKKIVTPKDIKDLKELLMGRIRKKDP